MKATKNALACPTIFLFSIIAAAQDVPAKPLMLDIEAQPMVDALNGWAQQTGLQLIVPEGRQTDRLVAPRVKGEFTAQAALSKLLAGTALTYEFVNDRTVVIHEDRPTASIEPILANDKVGESNFWRVAAAQGGDKEQHENDDSANGPGSRRVATARLRPIDRNNPDLEEVIVTAQKRAERLIDVPISIVAINADDLEERKITKLDELSATVPGLVIRPGAQSRSITMRGISNSQGAASLIGLYLDEAAATSPDSATQADLRAYDLERVEVLRGPQGTLYGEGSSGGTIRFITKKPLLDRFAMSTDGEAMATKDGAPSGRIQGMVNVPLVEDELGVRLVGTLDHQGGWMDQPAVGKEDINEQDVVNVRVKGLWQPSPQFAVNAMAVLHRDESTPSIGEDSSGNYTQSFNLATTPSGKSNYELYNLTLTYDFTAFQALSTTTYIEQQTRLLNHGRLYKQFLGTTGHYYVVRAPRESDTFTEEFRLTSIGSGPWQWTVGGLYRQAELAQPDNATIIALSAVQWTPSLPVPAAALSRSEGSSDSWAIFGDTSYELTDRVSVGAGLRYFEEDADTTNLVSGFAQSATFHTLNPRIYAKYKLTDQINTYASAAKGFRSGGFNAPLGTVRRPDYDPETVWTYELGTKAAFPEARLAFDMALFYTSYSDYQVTGVDTSNLAAGFIISNAGNVWIKGIEGSLTWRPIDQWEVGFNGTYNDSEFDEINVTSATASYAVGDRPDYSPEYGYTVSIERDFQWSDKPGFARVDYTEQGRMPFRNRTLGPAYFFESGIIETLNFNFSVHWNEQMVLGFFAQNLLNDRDFTNAGWNTSFAPRSRPRTFGVQVGYNFD